MTTEKDIVVHAVEKWRIARLKQQLVWAETGGECNDDAPDRCCEFLDEMRGWEEHLTHLEPSTIEGAIAMLSAAVEIMAAHAADSQSSLARGPVLELTSQAWRTLDAMPASKRGERRPRPLDAFGDVSGAALH